MHGKESNVKYARWFSVLVIFASFLFSGFSQASQNPVEIAKLEVNIWPEYDRPDTLVIYRITLTSDTKLPAQISLRIPRAAGSPYNVAFKDLDGLLYDIEYTLIPEGEWNRVVFITSSAEMQVEYYDPNIDVVGDQHTINYRWIGDYPIKDLVAIVQQPKDASHLVITPDLGLGVINPDDHLVYYTRDQGPLDVGIAFNLKLEYQKSTDSLSATSVSVKAAGELPIRRTLRGQLEALVLPITQNKGLVVLGILIFAWLVLFIAATFLSSGRSFDALKLKRRSAERNEAKVEEASQVYCYQCGKRARPGDVYCRVCGAKLQAP